MPLDPRMDTAMFATNEHGVVERSRTCECGRSFSQRLLSARFLTAVERRGQRAMDMLREQIPDYYVPVHCPPCERIDLGRRAQVDEHRLHFTERNEADYAA